jgi:hypothetical protein
LQPLRELNLHSNSTQRIPRLWVCRAEGKRSDSGYMALANGDFGEIDSVVDMDIVSD